MATIDANPNEAPEDRLQAGEVAGMPSWPVRLEGPHCDEATVRQTIDVLEQAALESHRERGMSDDELRITIHAADSARRDLTNADVNPCGILSKMLRQVLTGELEDEG